MQQQSIMHVYSQETKARTKARTDADLQPNIMQLFTAHEHFDNSTSRTGATHTQLHKTPKEKEVATSLSVSSPPPATSTPSPSGVVHELVPRVARLVRPTARTGFWGNGRGFPALSRARSRDSRARSRITRGRKGDWQEQRLNDQPTNRDPRETAAASEPDSTQLKQHLQHTPLL